MSCCSRYARITSGLSKYRSYADVLSCELSAPATASPNVCTRAELVVSRNSVCAGIKGSFSPSVAEQNFFFFWFGQKEKKILEREKLEIEERDHA